LGVLGGGGGGGGVGVGGGGGGVGGGGAVYSKRLIVSRDIYISLCKRWVSTHTLMKEW
jgi:hypothetical protein